MGAPARAARRRGEREAARQNGKPKTAKAPPAKPPEADTPAGDGDGDGDGQEIASMVLVGVQRAPNGRDLAVGPIVPQGDVGGAEVLHILEKAVKVWRKSAGLD